MDCPQAYVSSIHSLHVSKSLHKYVISVVDVRAHF